MAGFGRARTLLVGLLMGGLIGTALGVLLAPERGEQTRSRVRSRAEPVVERIRDTATRLGRRGETAVEEGEEAEEASVPEEAGDGG